MQKTVQVVDEAGIRYEATWERRARGLVKNGRARFIDENTICLACPPNKQNIISEDMKMTNTENRKENNFTSDELAKAVAEVVRCRETTNQRLIAFYEKMVDDCKLRREDKQPTEI